MATFIALEYEDPHKAHEVRLALVRFQREYLSDLEDAVVAVMIHRERSSCISRLI